MLDARLQVAIHGFDEVLAVEARVKTEDRAAQHALQDLAPPWADAERLGVGPGDVPEGQDGGLRQLLADHRRQQREVVVLHQHHRVGAACLGHHRVGKALVDGAVGFPVGFSEHRSHMSDMAERPHALVGEAVVVALLLFRGQPDAAQPVVIVPRRHAHPVGAVHDVPVGTAAAVCHPGARAGPHDRLHGRDQAAGRALDDHPWPSLVDVGLAVGDHDDLVAAQLGAQQRTQPLGRPLGFGPCRSAVLVLQIAHAGTKVCREGCQFGRPRTGSD